MSLLDRCVGAWNFNDASSLFVRDETGNGNHVFGTSITPTIIESMPFYGLISSSTLQSASIVAAGGNALDFVGPVSMMAWIYPTFSNNWQAGLVRADGAGTPTRPYSFFLADTGVNAVFSDIGGGSFAYTDVSSRPWAVNKRNCFVITADGVNQRAYINGLFAGSRACATVSTSHTANLCLGREIGEPWYTSYIGPSAVWSRVLDPGEINQLWNNGTGLLYPFGIRRMGKPFHRVRPATQTT